MNPYRSESRTCIVMFMPKCLLRMEVFLSYIFSNVRLSLYFFHFFMNFFLKVPSKWFKQIWSSNLAETTVPWKKLLNKTLLPFQIVKFASAQTLYLSIGTMNTKFLILYVYSILTESAKRSGIFQTFFTKKRASLYFDT